MTQKPSSGGDTMRPAKPTLSAKRAAPAKVPDVVFEGIRYAQSGSPAGEPPQHSGYLAAYREGVEEPLWALKIYDIRYEEPLETDVQDVYFTRMDLDEARRELVIENERGERYSVHLDVRKVTRLP